MRIFSRKISPAWPTLPAIALLAAFLAPSAFGAIADPNYVGLIMDPATQNKWVTAVPNALMPAFTYTPHTPLSATAAGFPAGICGVTEDCYTISVRQFTQSLGLVDEVTKAPLLTTVNGYGTATNAPAVGPFVGSVWHAPSPTFRSTSNRPYRVTITNELPNTLPPGHDPTVDAGPNALDNFPYNRIVTHMHGAHVQPDSDGYPEQWYTPLFAQTGTTYKPSVWGPLGTYRYENTQEAATTWYHDHASGLTHINTQMGMAGFSIITDDNEKCLQGTVVPGCAAPVKVLPVDPFEIGFALQDRNFSPTGAIIMPDQPIRNLLSPLCTIDPLTGLVNPLSCPTVNFSKAVDGHLIPYNAALPPAQAGPFTATSTTLEYFGNMPLVNGVVYGKYDVEPRWYRMRLIGGTDSRTWILKLVNRTTALPIPVWQIGSEQGLLNTPTDRTTTGITLMPGERVDLLVDFRALTVAGTKVVMQNLGPDTPLQSPPQPASTVIPEVMEFNSLGTAGLTATPDVTPLLTTNLRPVSGAIGALLPLTAPVRNVSLMEITDQYGRTMPTIDSRGFMQMGVPITERVKLNDVEQWDIINTTMDSHPMHLHLVAFRVVNRQALPPADPITGIIPGFVAPVTDVMTGTFTQPSYITSGPTIPVDPWDAGWKDTVRCPPGMVTRVEAKFDIPGLYVWHCHILSHEEHDMMRPFKVYEPTKIGVFRGGQWYLDKNGNNSWDTGIDTSSPFGIPGDKLVSGDWDGSGKTKIGAFRGGIWFLDANGNNVWDAGIDTTMIFGIPSDIPVTGDWNGDGKTEIGVVNGGSTWYLDKNGNGTWDVADVSYGFGAIGDVPITGDWDGSGTTKIGVLRGATWYLDKNGNGTWDATDITYGFGLAGDVPVTGDWNGDGNTEIGVVSGGATWYLDKNGNGLWDATDIAAGFGIPGDVAVTGIW